MLPSVPTPCVTMGLRPIHHSTHISLSARYMARLTCPPPQAPSAEICSKPGPLCTAGQNKKIEACIVFVPTAKRNELSMQMGGYCGSLGPLLVFTSGSRVPHVGTTCVPNVFGTRPLNRLVMDGRPGVTECYSSTQLHNPQTEILGICQQISCLHPKLALWCKPPAHLVQRE